MELNIEQKKAACHDSGPLLIIAGAGTGKTRVITSRILQLIKSGKAKSSEILALTFTEKAANEMVERIDEEMPLSYDELCVKTFHAFSDQILREAGLEIGIDPGYKILSQVEQWFFFKKNLFEFELDYYRPLGNPNRFIYAILAHFSKLKDELIKPEEYIAYAEKLPNAPDLDPEEVKKTQEISKAYKKYQELLLANNYLDFGDLSFYANELFEKRKSCLKKYQDRFKYILVDEFQDTNYAQFQLILKLAREHKNICVVGDDDQSIYKWRGASLSNILQFEKHFPESKKVVLLENYRSNQGILDAAYGLIQNNNPDRLEVKVGINKKLVAKASHNDGDAAAQVHHFPDFIQESSFVAEQIKKLHDEQGVNFGEFAILVRANHLTHPFIDELKYLGVPYQVRNPKGLFSLDEIKDLLAVIKVIANPYDNIALLRVLKMGVFGLAMSEILKLLNNAKHEHMFDLLKDAKEKIYEIISHLIEFSKDHSVGLVINEFLHKSNLLEWLIENEKFEELENINEFAKQVTKFEKNNEDKSARDFVNYLNLLEEANASFEGENFADRDSVQILTAHGSKGLEFEYVFVVNAVSQRFPGSKRSEPFEIPEKLTREIYPEGDFHLQEERRLFYVAMTRSKKKLFITYSDQYEGNKKWKVSPFVSEILGDSPPAAGVNKVEQTDHAATPNALEKLKEFKSPHKPIFDLPPFKSTKVSYSQFDTFKLCPLKYNYRYLMKVPVLESHAANFGNSVHKTLNEFYKILKDGREVNQDLLKELYEKNWIPYGYESKAHESARKEKGWEVLKIFYETHSQPWIVPAYLEQSFNLKVGKYWINGRIDRIDKLADSQSAKRSSEPKGEQSERSENITFEVIDYKTGAMHDNINLNKDLQLSIYAMACRDILKIKVSKLSLYFLEDNQKIGTGRTEEQLAGVEKEIIDLIKEMENSKFSPTPGFHCQFCDFRLICPAV